MEQLVLVRMLNTHVTGCFFYPWLMTSVVEVVLAFRSSTTPRHMKSTSSLQTTRTRNGSSCLGFLVSGELYHVSAEPLLRLVWRRWCRSVVESHAHGVGDLHRQWLGKEPYMKFFLRICEVSLRCGKGSLFRGAGLAVSTGAVVGMMVVWPGVPNTDTVVDVLDVQVSPGCTCNTARFGQFLDLASVAVPRQGPGRRCEHSRQGSGCVSHNSTTRCSTAPGSLCV